MANYKREEQITSLEIFLSMELGLNAGEGKLKETLGWITTSNIDSGGVWGVQAFVREVAAALIKRHREELDKLKADVRAVLDRE